jgi:hypothetical protein
MREKQKTGFLLNSPWCRHAGDFAASKAAIRKTIPLSFLPSDDFDSTRSVTNVSNKLQGPAYARRRLRPANRPTQPACQDLSRLEMSRHAVIPANESHRGTARPLWTLIGRRLSRSSQLGRSAAVQTLVLWGPPKRNRKEKTASPAYRGGQFLKLTTSLLLTRPANTDHRRCG